MPLYFKLDISMIRIKRVEFKSNQLTFVNIEKPT